MPLTVPEVPAFQRKPTPVRPATTELPSVALRAVTEPCASAIPGIISAATRAALIRMGVRRTMSLMKWGVVIMGLFPIYHNLFNR